MRLDGRVAIVTGAGRGIGRATARLFAAEGARLGLLEIDGALANDAVAEIAATGADVMVQTVDVSDPAAATAAIDAVAGRFGRLDILVNNAAILRDRTLVKMSDEEWDAVIAVNLRGVFACTRAAARHMVACRERLGAAFGGRIISAASIVGLDGNFGQTNYAAAKAGVVGMTRVWARELGRHNITANVVCPGFIDTEMARSVPADVAAAVRERTPLKRFGSPEEVARVYLFLASDEASFVNGAVIRVDGGLTL